MPRHHVKRSFTKTKIVCTLGPATKSAEMLSAMIRAGMDVARINLSHGTHAEHSAILSRLRRARNVSGEPVSVILDLQGPKIRIGELRKGAIELKQNQRSIITTKDVPGDEHILSTTYKNLPHDVRRGNKILLDDGKIELKVVYVKGREVTVRVVTGGTLSPHKGINLPGIVVSAPSMTEKDKDDLLFGFAHDIDYVALSFVRKADDVTELREFIIEHGPTGRKIPIIAKIEKGEAIKNIEEILRETDAVMVARGDLGVELPTEDVPLLQKMIVRRCNELGKPVIIATQMLESMINSPTPTRAEASDVANAVIDGTDAVMLSGETSIGKYPIRAIEVMDRIIRKTQDQFTQKQRYNPDWIPSSHEYDPLSRSACLLADQLGASTIVVLTHSGTSAAHVAKFRPPARIIAVTAREKIMRRLNLIWGIRGFIVGDLKKDTDKTFKLIQQRLKQEGYIERGETIVMVAGLPLFEGHPTNTIKVDKV